MQLIFCAGRDSCKGDIWNISDVLFEISFDEFYFTAILI